MVRGVVAVSVEHCRPADILGQRSRLPACRVEAYSDGGHCRAQLAAGVVSHFVNEPQRSVPNIQNPGANSDQVTSTQFAFVLYALLDCSHAERSEEHTSELQ